VNFKTISIILLIVLSLAFEITFVHHYTCDESVFAFHEKSQLENHTKETNPNVHQTEKNHGDKPSHNHESSDCHSCSISCEFCGKVFFNANLQPQNILVFCGFFKEIHINSYAIFFADPLFHPPNQIS